MNTPCNTSGRGEGIPLGVGQLVATLAHLRTIDHHRSQSGSDPTAARGGLGIGGATEWLWYLVPGANGDMSNSGGFLFLRAIIIPFKPEEQRLVD